MKTSISAHVAFIMALNARCSTKHVQPTQQNDHPSIEDSSSQNKSQDLGLEAGKITPSQQLPSSIRTVVVTQLNDENNGIADGNISLREAVSLVNSNKTFGVVRFDPALAGGTIRLTQGQFLLSSDIKIIGPKGGITIDAEGKSRLFRIENPDAAKQVGLENLTMMNGFAPD